MQKRNRVVICMTTALLALAPAAWAGTGQAADQSSAEFVPKLEIQQANGIVYVSGGIGDEEQEALQRARTRFNLRLSLVVKDGKYLGKGTIRIEDSTGKTVLEAPTNGPLFMAQLPVGRYKVMATASGETMTRTVSLAENDHQDLALAWPRAAGERPAQLGDAPAVAK